MKITVYTIKDCTFSKQEREYLNANKLVFEEKDLEINKDFLTEMLAISNNFAGTPVTRVEKDDGTISVLKGFTKEEFDKTFGFAQAQPSPEPAKPAPDVSNVPPSNGAVSQPTVPTDQSAQPITNSTDAVNPLKSIMDDLQSKSNPVQTVPPVEQTPTPPITNNQPPVAPPSTNDQPAPPPPAGAPTIPDFPTK